MRDPCVEEGDAPKDTKRANAAIDEVEKIFAFYKNKTSWLKPQTTDWSDVDRRAEAKIWIARCSDYMPAHVRELIDARLDEAKPLPRGRRYRKGENIPRNVVIVRVLRHLEQRGFKPVNISQDSGYSGCYIVECALERVGIKLGERQIEDIWASRPRTIADIRNKRAFSPNKRKARSYSPDKPV